MARISGTGGTERDMSRLSRCMGDRGTSPLKGVSLLSPPICAALNDLADRLRRLSPSIRDPERFHVEKSEIEHEMRELARVLPGQKLYGAAESRGSAETASFQASSGLVRQRTD